jgi:N-acetylmuramoyl-L-alanine amidase
MNLRQSAAAVLVLVSLSFAAACGHAAPASTVTPAASVTATTFATATSSPGPAAAEPVRSVTPSATATAGTGPAEAPRGAGPGPQPTVAPHDARPVAAIPRAPGDRTPVVVLDPGHAVDEVGAAANGVVEKDSNLDMALRVEPLLAAQGVRVILTRRADVRAFIGDSSATAFNTTRRDLEARIDLANESDADAFVSIHSNGAASTAERGVETYFNVSRPFADLNRTLATRIQTSVIAEAAAAGYPVTDRGAKDDSCLRGFQGRCFPLFVLGPARSTTGGELVQRDPGANAPVVGSRATNMPGALVELLFVSSPADAALLRDNDARNALARGVARGILDYLAVRPPR